ATLGLPRPGFGFVGPALGGNGSWVVRSQLENGGPWRTGGDRADQRGRASGLSFAEPRWWVLATGHWARAEMERQERTPGVGLGLVPLGPDYHSGEHRLRRCPSEPGGGNARGRCLLVQLERGSDPSLCDERSSQRVYHRLARGS